jgi:RNA recognition motif-containing protein
MRRKKREKRMGDKGKKDKAKRNKQTKSKQNKQSNKNWDDKKGDFGMNIYIGNFSYDITGDDLKEVFGAFGYVETVKVIRDKFTGDSKGFGFVEMPNTTEAQAAVQGITEIKGRRITINEARPQARNNYGPSKKGNFRRPDTQRRERRY